MSSRSLSDAVNIFSTLKSHTLLGNLKYCSFYQSLTSLEKTKLWSRFYVDEEENQSDVLDILATDQKIITSAHSSRKRRTVLLKRSKNTQFGFTVQTYIIRKSADEVPLKISYIDYVHFEGPAADAGIRPGDVIVSINGMMVTEVPHNELIALISSCEEMRMILVFENIRERIQLIARSIRLKKLLNDKLYQLNLIDIQEQNILNRACARAMASKKRAMLNGSVDSYNASLLSQSDDGDSPRKSADEIFSEAEKCSGKGNTQKPGEAAEVPEGDTGGPRVSRGQLKAEDSRSAVNPCFEEDSYPEVTRL